MITRRSRTLWAATLLLAPAAAHAEPWFADRSDALRTDRFSFGGANPEAGDTNENYYDGDFADFDGDGRLDRGMISRYGLLWNAAGGLMTPVANTVQGATYQFGDKDAIGNDAICWADVDRDGDPDSVQGGNGEALTLQINQAGRFSIKWRKAGSSAKRIVKIDLERDGDVDLIVAGAFCLTRNCGQPDDFTVWVNDGTGQFTDETVARGLDYRTALIAGVSAGDLDGDGDFDLVVMSGTRRRAIALINNGAGVFSERPFFTIPDGLWTYQTGGETSVGLSGSDNTALGDVDGDGDLDLVTGAFGPIGGHPNVFYPLFINDGAGNFTEQGATRFHVGAFAGHLYATDIKLADFDGDGDLDLAAYAQTGFADLQENHLQLFVNDGTGNFTFTRDLAPAVMPPTGGINAFDAADYSGDGAVDLWIGNQGGRVLTFVNTYVDPLGVPADQPRNLRVVSATAAGVRLSWQPPPSAATVRFYRVYRATRPGLPIDDRILVKTVAISPHADDGFVAPITRRTTAAQLADPSVTIDPGDGTLTWTDATGAAGVSYQYSVVQVGNETKASAPTPEVSAATPGPAGADTVAPYLAIVGPTRQHWQASPRIVLQYADAQSGVDPSSIRVSFDAACGDRPAGADLGDLATWKDSRLFVAALVPPFTLPINTLVTMTASVADLAGNRTTQTVQFFVTTASARLPTAAFAATPTTGDAPLAVDFDASASSDPDGKVVRYEWYFGDGELATGLVASHRYLAGGTYEATLVVRDTEGGAATTSRTITAGAAPECSAGEARSCYSGPTATAGVGACVAGSQTCAAGAWPSACAGEVVPAVEVCADSVDNDCDGLTDGDDPDCVSGQAPGGCGCGASAPLAPGAPGLLVVLGLLRRRRAG
ncbi:MAG TPA: FG-GAP-like repeat-containing protein [Kofleriaceae bacterium]|nr:FG-GAP-like repeat-containing protein [Kofleriaceae bacterium]